MYVHSYFKINAHFIMFYQNHSNEIYKVLDILDLNHSRFFFENSASNYLFFTLYIYIFINYLIWSNLYRKYTYFKSISNIILLLFISNRLIILNNLYQKIVNIFYEVFKKFMN